LFVLYCSMYCLCVNVYCHRVTTQLQLTNISYHFQNSEESPHQAIRMAADDNVAHVLIDRLKSFAATPHNNVTAFRSVAARLHSRAASQGGYVVLGCVGVCWVCCWVQ